jgi:hypothetical protein
VAAPVADQASPTRRAISWATNFASASGSTAATAAMSGPSGRVLHSSLPRRSVLLRMTALADARMVGVER